MKALEYEISKEYSHELSEIADKLNELKQNQVYELTQIRSDGTLYNNVKELERRIILLLTKIQHGEDGFDSSLAKYFDDVDI